MKPLPVDPIFNPSPTNLFAQNPPASTLDMMFGAPVSMGPKEVVMNAHEDP